MTHPDLSQLLKKHSIDISPEFQGIFQRNGSQWFKGTLLKVGDKELPCALYGDFARGISERWVGSEQLDAGAMERVNDALRAVTLEANAERQRGWELEAEISTKQWAEFLEEGSSPYFAKKGLQGLHGCRLEPDPHGARTIVPARDIHGKLWGFQRIYSEKLSIGTDKVFRKGARKSGCFHLLGPAIGKNTVYLCEGIATAISIKDAMGEVSVLSCFDARNMALVAQSVREQFPYVHVHVCGDNDSYGENPSFAGLKAAKFITEEVNNSTYSIATFKPEDAHLKLTDYNDVHVQYGKDALKSQLTKDMAPKEPDEKPNAALGEASLVARILDSFEPNLLRQGKDFFKYTGTHWEHMEPLGAPDYFKRLIDFSANKKLKFKDIQSAYNRFFIHVPRVPEGINLFSPNPFKQNFKNGTMTLTPESNGTFKISFGPHSREDYLIHCHDFDYVEHAPRNEEFEATLDRIWIGEEDIEAKKQAYFEVLGACLVSAFRKLVIFVGPPKAGKSTLILFAVNMVHEKYRCSVDPSQFQGFNLESMAGKLLNFDTDINLIKPITDSILKKVEDRAPMRIARKGIADIYAPIPGMQLFGANRMPRSQEAGEAYARRMIVFRCDKYQPRGDLFVLDHAQHVWRQNSAGIVSRAVEGLKRLCDKGGHFTVPESSKVELAAWKNNQGDMVQDFILDIETGGASDHQTTVFCVKGAEIERRLVWDAFKAWGESFAPRTVLMGKIKFYARLVELGYRCKKVNGVHHFEGLSIAPGEESII